MTDRSGSSGHDRNGEQFLLAISSTARGVLQTVRRDALRVAKPWSGFEILVGGTGFEPVTPAV